MTRGVRKQQLSGDDTNKESASSSYMGSATNKEPANSSYVGNDTNEGPTSGSYVGNDTNEEPASSSNSVGVAISRRRYPQQDNRLEYVGKYHQADNNAFG